MKETNQEMVNPYYGPIILSISVLLMVVSSCRNLGESVNQEAKRGIFSKMTIDRYAVEDGNPDSIQLSSYIVKLYDDQGKESKAVYHSSDSSIMMQFINHYRDGMKNRIDWVNGDNEMVRYVKNTFDDDGRIIRSEAFNPPDTFISGFIHQWTNEGKVEQKGPIEEGKPFRPNARYYYNEKDEFELLLEYDADDSLYATVRWEYLAFDSLDNWIERNMITNDTLNQVEKRRISYR